MNEKLTVRCNGVTMQDNRGIVSLVVLDKEKKVQTNVQVLYIDPKEAAKYEHGKTYTVTITEAK